MKRKVLSVLMLVVMSSAMIACGSKSAQKDVEPSTAVEAESTVAVESSSVAEASVEETTSEEQGLGGFDAISGVIDGNVYTSEIGNYKITIPEDWSILNEEEMLEINGIVKESISKTDIAEYLEKNGIYYDLVTRADNGANINVILQQSEVNVNTKQLEESIMEQTVLTMKDQLPLAGMSEDFECSVQKVMIDGEEKNVIITKGIYSGVNMEQIQIFTFTEDYYWICTATVFPDSCDETIYDLAGMISKIK